MDLAKTSHPVAVACERVAIGLRVKPSAGGRILPLFLDMQGTSMTGMPSKMNRAMAVMIVQSIQTLLQNLSGHQPNQVIALTPYLAQLPLIRGLLGDVSLYEVESETSVVTASADSFQGRMEMLWSFAPWPSRPTTLILLVICVVSASLSPGIQTSS